MTGAELLAEIRAAQPTKPMRTSTPMPPPRPVTCCDCNLHVNGIQLKAAPDKGRGKKRHLEPVICDLLRAELKRRVDAERLAAARNKADEIIARRREETSKAERGGAGSETPSTADPCEGLGAEPVDGDASASRPTPHMPAAALERLMREDGR